MAEFKNKEEYEKWKAHKVQQANDSSTRAERKEVTAYENTSSKRKVEISKNLVVIIIGLFVVLTGVLGFLLISRPNSSPLVNNNASTDSQKPINTPPKEKVETDKIDTTKFDGLNRAAKKIEASTSVGVSYQQMGELLQNLATELSVAKDKISSNKEKTIFGQYSDILDAYKDSHLLWKYKIEDHAGGKVWAMDNIIKVDEYRLDLIPIISKYNISERKISNFSTISADSIKDIWRKAHEDLNKISVQLQSRT